MVQSSHHSIFSIGTLCVLSGLGGIIYYNTVYSGWIALPKSRNNLGQSIMNHICFGRILLLFILCIIAMINMALGQLHISSYKLDYVASYMGDA
jgi:uncharacterized membrane protein